MIFLPARPGSQTHASHKGRMFLNHESHAGCIKIVAKSLHLVFATFVLSVCFFFNLRTVSRIILVKTGTEKTPQQYSDHYFPWETRVFRYEEYTGKSQYRTTGKNQCR